LPQSPVKTKSNCPSIERKVNAVVVVVRNSNEAFIIAVVVVEVKFRLYDKPPESQEAEGGKPHRVPVIRRCDY
jgi:hypothetical protein